MLHMQHTKATGVTASAPCSLGEEKWCTGQKLSYWTGAWGRGRGAGTAPGDRDADLSMETSVLCQCTQHGGAIREL